MAPSPSEVSQEGLHLLVRRLLGAAEDAIRSARGKSAAASAAEEAAEPRGGADIIRWVNEMLPDFVRNAPKDHPGACVSTYEKRPATTRTARPSTPRSSWYSTTASRACWLPEAHGRVTRADIEASFPAESSIIAWHEGREDISAAAARGRRNRERARGRARPPRRGRPARAARAPDRARQGLGAGAMDRMLEQQERLQQQQQQTQQQDDKQSVRLLSAAQQNDAEQVQALVEKADLGDVRQQRRPDRAAHRRALGQRRGVRGAPQARRRARRAERALRRDAAAHGGREQQGPEPPGRMRAADRRGGRRLRCRARDCKTASQQAARVPGPARSRVCSVLREGGGGEDAQVTSERARGCPTNAAAPESPISYRRRLRG